VGVMLRVLTRTPNEKQSIPGITGVNKGSMNTLVKFDEVRDAIKSYLPQYLSKFGIDARERKAFPCLSPTHQDKHPSCGIIPGTALFHCFSCGVTGDIFDAANAKENKPLTGRGFITDNLFYLAKTFGVAIPELDISDEEMFEIDARRAYAQASRIVLQSKQSDVVKNKLVSYLWPADVINKFGIGSVESFDDYMSKMTKTHGHTTEFLKKIDLDRRGIFNENNLIYTIKDEHGSPIAFSARNLHFEEEKEAYRVRVGQIQASTITEAQKKEEIEKVWKPRKYVNSAETILFNKSKVLFNFDQAKKVTNRTLLVFEGNPDCVTLYAAGVKSATATCGTAFTTEHLELALANGVVKIVLVYDPDKGGKEGTERFIKMLEQFGNHIGLEVEIIVMPEGTDDPDAYVRAFGTLAQGVAEFRKLPRTDLFTWKLKKQIEEGADPYEIASSSIPDIVNTENNLIRLQKADRLAEATSLPKEFIHRELLRLVDSNEMKAEEERATLAAQTVKALQQNPKAMESILATAATRLESIAESRTGYDVQVNVKAYLSTIDKMETSTDMFELVTGYPIFDSLMGGIPKEGVMMSVPGKPHHGKSIGIDNMIINALELNPKLQVMLHHVDDAALLRVPRLLGIMSGLSSRLISKAGAGLAGDFGPEFEERYRKAVDKLTEYIKDERLILADQATLVNSLTAHERWIKEIRRRNPGGHFISVGDNFHLFDMPGMDPGEGKVREMSKFISNLPTKHGITTIFTMELPKDILKPGTRPKYTDSKNSGGIAFDSKVNMNVYQELQDLGDESQLSWRSSQHMQQIITPDGSPAVVEKVLPIVELIIDKNKVTGEKRTIFFRLEPMSGRMEECSEQEQTALQLVLESSKKERKANAQKQSFAENRRAF
jgi:DNA primase